MDNGTVFLRALGGMLETIIQEGQPSILAGGSVDPASAHR